MARNQYSQTRAWFSSSIENFLDKTPEEIIGTLDIKSDFDVVQLQRDAWLGQIDVLSDALMGFAGELYFEFSIPRMGQRIDVVVVIGPICFVVEFKVGETSFRRDAIEQVWDYALDLKNFHEASHDVPIVPVLVATDADNTPPITLNVDHDGVYRPVCVGFSGLRELFSCALQIIRGENINSTLWSLAPYRPTPTIIESARALYAQHSVENIARNDAGAKNLAITSFRIDELVDSARELGQKLICFVTGVPGAGKTLVGLNVATRHRRELEQPTHAIFLSGNGPLVAVLHEALTRDEVRRRQVNGEKVRKGQVRAKVKALIQNVHHFRDEALFNSNPPIDHVVIFDEAQRAWNLEQTANFMQRKKKWSGFDQSEAEYLINYMDRHDDWAVIVCLVGGGQEINTGEAGIDAWLDAIHFKYPHWHAYISSRLTDSEYAAGKALHAAHQCRNMHFDDSLHLAVSMRSYRAENVSAFVKALLDNECKAAEKFFNSISSQYPVVLTRDLERAKQWTRSRARGSERYGLLASSKAQRLKPYAIDVRVNINPVHWFLNDRDDTRSSFYLEDAATEFQAQGLELDWACITWDGDLRFTNKGWSYHEFRGSRWCNIRKVDKQKYLLNAYRVLLTRARQGMVIFVPFGDSADSTRLPDYYESTFQYLVSIGIPLLE